MAKSGEFYTFDEVVRQLKIDQNKLKRLVSEGEISAFREGDVMKFKKSEIDKLASKGTGSETSETVLSEITLEDEVSVFIMSRFLCCYSVTKHHAWRYLVP